MSWQALIDGNPELAAYGEKRFTGRVAYLATTRPDGAPTVHPISPQLFENRLFVFMYPTSPKAHDLQRGSHFALHCAVEDNTGGAGEFYVRGKAQQIHDARIWSLIRPDHPEELDTRYILFEFTIDQAFSMTYGEGDETLQNRWKRRHS